ncbi:hypothetical protein HFA01_16660 [Halobacillus faecis]|uniref:Uncharacterized protein n=1 Tax=Halobacillus faecis TaxID=360184 RepID=A0A511WQI4_9BACI|nr:hypothetical protein HFA01_16660 [Halobacillus faecis]
MEVLKAIEQFDVLHRGKVGEVLKVEICGGFTVVPGIQFHKMFMNVFMERVCSIQTRK